jgi:hypothetical protein
MAKAKKLKLDKPVKCLRATDSRGRNRGNVCLFHANTGFSNVPEGRGGREWLLILSRPGHAPTRRYYGSGKIARDKALRDMQDAVARLAK